MSQFTNKVDVITGDSSSIRLASLQGLMNSLINPLINFGILKATALLFFGCIRFSAFGEPFGFWESQSGRSVRSCC